MFTSCKCEGPELEELGRIRPLGSPQQKLELYQTTTANPKPMATISAQRLCPTSKVPAPLPAGVIVAEPLGLPAEARDESTLEADAEMDEIADETCAEIDEETPGGTLPVPLLAPGPGAGGVSPLAIVVVPEVIVVNVAGIVAVTLVSVIPGIVIVVDGEEAPAPPPPGAPVGSVHVS
jgi:hypothetical protein